MKKIRIANKILIGCAAATAIASATAICFTVGSNNNDPLRYKQEVNASKYAASATKEDQTFISFPHNYHSMDYEYQKYYWVDVSRENIKDPQWDPTLGEEGRFVATHFHQPAEGETLDVTLDRFTNLFYPKNTIVSIFDKDATADDEGKAYTGEGLYKDQSVLTSWTSQNGFAYISQLIDEPFDTEIERKAYKEKYPDKYDVMVENYKHANTFINVFGGNRDVAQYFFSGIKVMSNEGKGLAENETLDGQVITFETAKVTKSSINKFAQWLIKSAKSEDLITLDFSQLFLKDLDRDNSILSLLNPQLWDNLMTYMQGSDSEEDPRPQKYISKIDLSYNNLRVVPNIASIRNKTDTDWFWETVKVNKGVEESEHSGMNHIYVEANGPIPGGLAPLAYQQDGYFDGIDLSHNNLTYFDYNAYNPWNEEYDSTTGLILITDGKSNYLKGYKDNASNRTPSLATLVKCRYDEYKTPIEYLLDPTELKPKEDKFIGINLDYNHLTWIMMHPLSKYAENWKPEEHNGEPYVWWMPMLKSWLGIALKDIGELVEVGLPDYVFSYVRSYITYSTCITKTNVLEGAIPVLEYVLGLGAYQNDATNYTEKEIYNYIMCNSDSFGRELLEKDKASQVTNDDTMKLRDSYLQEFMYKGQLISFPLDKYLTDVSIFQVNPTFVCHLTTSDDLDGVDSIPIKFGLARIQYLPETLNVSDETSLNDIATKLFSTVAINYHTTFNIPGFIKDYTAAIGVGVGLGCFVLLIIIIAIIKLISNVKHQFEYRENELKGQLDEKTEKQAKKKRK